LAGPTLNIVHTLQFISVAVLPLIFAITVHEAAHGWVASKLGDPTAKQLGRLTLNPLPHIDPVGTVILPIAMLVLSGFIFGWAKPVPVNIRNFREPRKDMAMVALAGPISNLMMALFWGLMWKLAVILPGSMHWFAVPLLLMGKIGIQFNFILLVLNLLPLPPLDGSRVLSWLLPTQLALKLDKIEPYGAFILIGLLLLGLWNVLIAPVTFFLSGLVEQILGLTT
jgi:Zn-dependent protease